MQKTATRRTSYNEAYIGGSAAPQRKYEPVPSKSREQIRKERESRKAVERNQERALSMNKGYVAFLTLAMLVCLGACIVFIHIQSDITSKLATISSLETQVNKVKEENITMEKRLDTALNLEQIKEEASALGMVYPSSDQIEYYAAETDDYMKQY